MRSPYMNILSELELAEQRYSNADGGIDDLQDMITEDFGNAEGDVMAQAAAPLKSPNPYVLNVQNTTAGTLTCILFGKNQYYLSTNFGNATGIVITPAASNITYAEVIAQSGEQPFDTSLIRIKSTNTSQVTQVLTVTVKDINGQSATNPIFTESYFSAYQQQGTLVDVPYNLRIDGNVNVQFSVLANTTVTVTFFPASKVNTARALGGRGALANYGTPQVNIGGFTFPSKRSLTAQKL